jgi:hypothetical protein
MSTTTNGKTTNQTLGLSTPTMPLAKDNPFLAPAWERPLAADLALPPAPGLGSNLTKKQRLIYEEGQAQLLRQHFQRVKGGYAVLASAQIEDLANRCFVRVGTNVALRTTGPHPAALQPYLDLMMDAQLRRLGQELNQIASTHARTQHDLVAEPIEIDAEDLVGFWDRIVRGVGRG